MKKNKAFTLIELLVVVAIIGILAAVGVVAYNGYTSAAKIATSKANQKSVIKWVTAEAQKCQLGLDSILNGEITSVGVKIPTTKDIYIPVLKELAENGINFVEEEIN